MTLELERIEPEPSEQEPAHIELILRSMGGQAIASKESIFGPNKLSIKEQRYNRAIEQLMKSWKQTHEDGTVDEIERLEHRIRQYTRLKIGLLLGSKIDWSKFDEFYGGK